MRRIVLAALAVLSLGGSGGGEQGALTPLRDATLVEFLANLDHVASSEGLEFVVRIFERVERGECFGPGTSCPDSQLYITACTIDLDPDCGIFALPATKGWQFDGWGPAPQRQYRQDFVTILLTRKLVSPEARGDRLTRERVVVRVNPWGGTIRADGP